jgi:hypothetical protein
LPIINDKLKIGIIIKGLILCTPLRIVKIKQIIEESRTVKTFIFDWEVKNEIPGQFYDGMEF